MFCAVSDIAKKILIAVADSTQNVLLSPTTFKMLTGVADKVLTVMLFWPLMGLS